VVEAVNDERISVGTPYFNRMTAPIGLALLFLMAVAPPCRGARPRASCCGTGSGGRRGRGVAALVGAVAVGARGTSPLLAFGLGGFAAAAAIRQLALAVGAARRQGASVLRAFVGRSNGGMIVHLGVVVVAVAFTAASSYTTSATFTLAEGDSARIAGHTVTYEGMNPEDVQPQRTQVSARIRVDGGQVYEPALNQFPNATQTIGTPSVRVGAVEDVYLTLVAAPERAGGPSCSASSSSRWPRGSGWAGGSWASARSRGRGRPPVARGRTTRWRRPRRAAGRGPPAAGGGRRGRAPTTCPCPRGWAEWPSARSTRTRADLVDDARRRADDDGPAAPRGGRRAHRTAVGVVLAAFIAILATGEPATSRLGGQPAAR
jgi:hypothetical protein